MNMKNNLIEIASKYEPIQRVNGNGVKPRFISQYGDYGRVFNSTLRWLRMAELEEPPYSVDSRLRDRWLQGFWRVEPFLAGIINNVTSIDANRGWTLTGGRNQVRKWTARLHDSANGKGWRYLIKTGSLSFWTTDINSIFGVEREEPYATLTREGVAPSPMLKLWNIDPSKCNLFPSLAYAEEIPSLEVQTEIMYKNVPLMPWDYFRVASMPNDMEEYRGLGYSALSRCLNLAKLLYAVYQYDQEKLLAKAPRGLLLLHNITESQWNTAMEARDQRMSAKERQYYGGVEVLASDGGEYNPDAKLVALSQLPDGFDQKIMTDLLIYGYALCFGYDPREFWPVSGGTLGTGRETEIQAAKASGKGGKDFAWSFLECLQGELPETVHFEFEERDERGELLDAEILEAKTRVIERLSGLREQTGAVLTNEQVMTLLAQAGLVPEEWTLQEEDVTATDDEQLRQRLLDNPKIRSACELYHNEPIVMYRWVSDGQPKEKVLWATGGEAINPKVWQLNRSLYKGDRVEITIGDIREAISG